MAKPSRTGLWTVAGVLGGAALLRWQLARWFTQQPRYELERRVGDLEVRVYDARWVAETLVTNASWDEALSEGFRRLAGYVFGENRPSPFQPERLGKVDPAPAAALDRVPGGSHEGSSESAYVIPMPTLRQRPAPRGERLAMTSPVNVTTHGDRQYTIIFNLPEGRTLASLPAPKDERVQLERRPRRRVAVLRYRGPYSGPRVARKFSELMGKVRSAGLAYRGSPEFAGYDPPSTVPLLRRNEVWLELEPS